MGFVPTSTFADLPAMEVIPTTSDNSLIDSDLTDSDSMMDDESTDVLMPLTGRKRTVIDLSSEDDDEAVPSVPMDLAAKQKQRRQFRMDILRRKRQRKGSNNSNSSSPSVVASPVVDLSSSSPASFMFESCAPIPSSTEGITDPKLLRKLRNRESAARSRQKLLDLIDSLTCELCDRYVTYQDLQDQMMFLSNNVDHQLYQMNCISSSSHGQAALSQYSSLDNLILWEENDLDSINNDYVSPCQSPNMNFTNFQDEFTPVKQQQQSMIPSQSLNYLMEFFFPVDNSGVFSCAAESDSFAHDYLDYLMI
jgi:hypothetical protein